MPTVSVVVNQRQGTDVNSLSWSSYGQVLLVLNKAKGDKCSS